MMNRLVFTPPNQIGGFKIGMPRAEARSVIGPGLATSVHGAGKWQREVDGDASFFVQLSFDPLDRVNHIQVSGDRQVVYDGIDLIGARYSDLKKAFQLRGLVLTRNSLDKANADCDQLNLHLYLDRDICAAVSIWAAV